MSEPLELYKFRGERGWKGSQPVVGIVDKDAVLSLVGRDDMVTLFGGYVEYERRNDAARFVGVWSDRTVARFVKFSRERTEVDVVSATPADFRQIHRAAHYS